MEENIVYDEEHASDLNPVVDIDLLSDALGEDFFHGVNLMAETAGKIHTLSLVGVEPEDALEYLMTMQVMEQDERSAKESNDIALKIAKMTGSDIEDLEL